MGNKKSRFINDSLMLFRISLRNSKIILISDERKKFYITLLSYLLQILYRIY